MKNRVFYPKTVILKHFHFSHNKNVKFCTIAAYAKFLGEHDNFFRHVVKITICEKEAFFDFLSIVIFEKNGKFYIKYTIFSLTNY
jgi:hypothetical protein